MTKLPKPSTLLSPSLFISPPMRQDIAAIRSRRYRWIDQPFWPQNSIAFTDGDRGKRRKLITALVAAGSHVNLLSIGHKLLVCSRTNRCGSPLCNYCRTQLQDRYEKRVLGYFANTHRNDIVWLTLLDDLSYDPLNEVPERIKKHRISTRDFLKRHFKKDVRVFGAYEIDVKRPDLGTVHNAGVELLREYGFRNNSERAYMPHFHAIVSLNGISADDFGDKLRSRFKKSKQVTIKKLTSNKTKVDNLATLARYPFKFRYQFADNIKRDKPSYKSRFDDETLRVFTQLVHSIKGSRGAVGFEFRYNL